MLENKPNFLAVDQELHSLEELRGEQNYFEKIKRIVGTNKLLKQMKQFDSSKDAQDFLENVPTHSEFDRYLPKTEYLIAKHDDKVTVFAITDKLEGERLDGLELAEQSADFLNQLDAFLFTSFTYFERTGRIVGMNWKNFVLTEGKLYFVDSEPFPEVQKEDFEVARAAHARLLKDFGEKYVIMLPKVSEWIQNHMVKDYQKAKSQAKKRRRELKQSK